MKCRTAGLGCTGGASEEPVACRLAGCFGTGLGNLSMRPVCLAASQWPWRDAGHVYNSCVGRLIDVSRRVGAGRLKPGGRSRHVASTGAVAALIAGRRRASCPMALRARLCRSRRSCGAAVAALLEPAYMRIDAMVGMVSRGAMLVPSLRSLNRPTLALWVGRLKTTGWSRRSGDYSPASVGNPSGGMVPQSFECQPRSTAWRKLPNGQSHGVLA